MKAAIAVPITLLMVLRAYSHQSLTPAGIAAAVLTAAAHAVHPWNLPFALLIVFFLAGTRVTKIKHDVKASLTVQAGGTPSGEGARTHIQVFANSGIASILTLIHAYQLQQREQGFLPRHGGCYPWGKDLLVVGIITNYAAVTADTFSSELGILSKSQPRLITSWNLRKVPPGTNGGVTLGGLAAGLLGSIVIVTASILFTPFCPPAMTGMGWSFEDRQQFILGLALWGALGSVLDSFLGGWLQASVIDTRSGKIVEGEGGRKVLVSKAGASSMHYKKRADVKAALLHGDGKAAIPKTNDSHIEDDLDKKMGGMDKYDPKKSRTSSFGDEKPSRVVESGSLGLLDNNEVNFVMALTMSLGAMGIASLVWGVSMQTIFTF